MGRRSYLQRSFLRRVLYVGGNNHGITRGRCAVSFSNFLR
jgi:hypothetical protein